MNTSLQQQRAAIRQRLQAQRQAFSRQLLAGEPGHAPAGSSTNTFPRSMTMRLLTQRHNLSLLIVTELAPLLLRHFFGRQDTTTARISLPESVVSNRR